MAFATITTDATWAARLAAPVVRPAVFVFLDWPTAEVRVSTHHKEVTTTDDSVSPAVEETWTGVGEVAKIEAPDYKRNGALVTYKVGYTSLPQGEITEATEAAAIGRRAKVYLGLADEGWGDFKLKRIFIGHILNAGDFKHRRENGNWLTDPSLEISNGRSPRRTLQNHHSPETAEGSDTAWRLLPTAGKSLKLWA